MKRLAVRRVRFSDDADARLKMLKSRTGVTPNLLCRIGFCMSLEEPGVPNPALYNEGVREINRETLTGEYDLAFEALLRQRLAEDDLDDSQIDEQFRAHMNRGVELASTRIRSLGDLVLR